MANEDREGFQLARKEYVDGDLTDPLTKSVSEDALDKLMDKITALIDEPFEKISELAELREELEQVYGDKAIDHMEWKGRYVCANIPNDVLEKLDEEFGYYCGDIRDVKIAEFRRNISSPVTYDYYAITDPAYGNVPSGPRTYEWVITLIGY